MGIINLGEEMFIICPIPGTKMEIYTSLTYTLHIYENIYRQCKWSATWIELGLKFRPIFSYTNQPKIYIQYICSIQWNFSKPHQPCASPIAKCAKQHFKVGIENFLSTSKGVIWQCIYFWPHKLQTNCIFSPMTQSVAFVLKSTASRRSMVGDV